VVCTPAATVGDVNWYSSAIKLWYTRDDLGSRKGTHQGKQAQEDDEKMGLNHESSKI